MNKILIVEDLEVTRTLLKAFLSKKGLEVEMCSSGEEAFLTVPQFKPDIVLLDINMPGVNGFEVCQWIKELDENIIVIYITSEKSDEMKIKAFKTGGNDFIVKPFEGAMVWEVISKNLKILDKLDDKDKTIFQFEEQSSKYEKELLTFSSLKEIGLLSSIISHDINNFLGGIMGNVDLIEISYDRFEIEEACGNIRRALKNISGLTSQITALSKDDSNEKVKTFNLIMALNDAVNLIELNNNFNVMINRDYNISKDVLIKTSRSEVTNVFINILKNACEAVDGNGSNTVSITEKTIDSQKVVNGELFPGDYAIVKIIDNGIGIPEEKLNEIGQPFKTSKKTGLGLGMSSVLKYLSKNSGGMTIESKLGVGTTVSLYLNSTARKNRAEHTQVFFKPEYDFSDKAFLVIEDDQIMAKGIKKFLTKFNGQCELFVEGNALDRYKDFNFDIVIFDQNYQSLDIESFIENNTSKVLIISGEECKFGHCFLKKPFSFFELADKINEMLQGSPA